MLRWRLGGIGRAYTPSVKAARDDQNIKKITPHIGRGVSLASVREWRKHISRVQ